MELNKKIHRIYKFCKIKMKEQIVKKRTTIIIDKLVF